MPKGYEPYNQGTDDDYYFGTPYQPSHRHRITCKRKPASALIHETCLPHSSNATA